MLFRDTDTQDLHKLSIYNYKLVDNVNKYSYQNFDTWNIDISERICADEDKSYYLIIDTQYNEAFAHWVYESAIYLPLFLELKKVYPTLKIHLQCHRSFKLLFCEHFAIHKDDIVLELKNNNICVFPLPITAHNKKSICDGYIALLDAFSAYIHSNISIKDKYISTLLMPRQSKENYVGNDRRYTVDDIVNHLVDNTSSRILNTDTIGNLQEQIDIVGSSKNIVLSGGSAYFVNGIISKDSNIIVLDGVHHTGQLNTYPKVNYIDYTIKRRNKVTILPNLGTFTFDDIKQYLDP